MKHPLCGWFCCDGGGVGCVEHGDAGRVCADVEGHRRGETATSTRPAAEVRASAGARGERDVALRKFRLACRAAVDPRVAGTNVADSAAREHHGDEAQAADLPHARRAVHVAEQRPCSGSGRRALRDSRFPTAAHDSELRFLSPPSARPHAREVGRRRPSRIAAAVAAPASPDERKGSCNAQTQRPVPAGSFFSHRSPWESPRRPMLYR
jgi:hypothetical protein